MSEPLITEKSPDPGRPRIADEQYWKWLEEMHPFLIQGCSLWYAMDKCNLLSHQEVIYAKYREDEKFARKVDAWRSQIGELANLIGYKILNNINAKLLESNGSYEITNQEMNIWKTIAEKHRTAQPFFANRTEEAEANPDQFGKVIERPIINYVIPKETESSNKPSENIIQPDTKAAPSVEDTDRPNN